MNGRRGDDSFLRGEDVGAFGEKAHQRVLAETRRGGGRRGEDSGKKEGGGERAAHSKKREERMPGEREKERNAAGFRAFENRRRSPVSSRRLIIRLPDLFFDVCPCFAVEIYSVLKEVRGKSPGL